MKGALDYYSKRNNRYYQLFWRMCRPMKSLMEVGSVCGNFFETWGSPTKKNSKQLLYEQHDNIEQRCTYLQAIRNCDKKNKKQL